MIEHSFSKYFSQNDKNIPPIKSWIGLCLYAGLGDVQPTLRNKIMVQRISRTENQMLTHARNSEILILSTFTYSGSILAFGI